MTKVTIRTHILASQGCILQKYNTLKKEMLYYFYVNAYKI